MMKTLILFSFLSIVPVIAMASVVNIDDIYYNIDFGTKAATVTESANSYSGNIVIPETVTYSGVTYTVTSIERSAFYKCTGLTSVTIPNSVTSIERSAFSDCI